MNFVANWVTFLVKLRISGSPELIYSHTSRLSVLTFLRGGINIIMNQINQINHSIHLIHLLKLVIISSSLATGFNLSWASGAGTTHPWCFLCRQTSPSRQRSAPALGRPVVPRLGAARTGTDPVVEAMMVTEC